MNIFKNKNKKIVSPPTTFSRKSGGGFTVIELLVVVAVLGLLSSIILVSTRGARGKAQIAKVLQYSASLHHLLGVDIVGEWKFEDNFNDTSGNGNNGTGFGGITFPNNDASPQLGKAANFDGVDDYVNCGNKPSLNITKIITIEAWAKYGTMTGSRDILCHTGCNGYFLYVPLGTGIAIGQQCNGDTLNANVNLNDNKWHHLVGTYDGTTAKIYVDGVLKNSGTKSWAFNNTGNLAIGRAGNLNDEYFNGLIDEVRIYAQALSAAEIQKLYVEGIKKFGLTVK